MMRPDCVDDLAELAYLAYQYTISFQVVDPLV